jgi:hypothetical protein
MELNGRKRRGFLKHQRIPGGRRKRYPSLVLVVGLESEKFYKETYRL